MAWHKVDIHGNEMGAQAGGVGVVLFLMKAVKFWMLQLGKCVWLPRKLVVHADSHLVLCLLHHSPGLYFHHAVHQVGVPVTAVFSCCLRTSCEPR